MKKKVAIIGLGNIGQRHLQGIMNYSSEYDIYGVDNDSDKIQELKTRYHDDCVLLTTFEGLPKSIDMVVVATASSVRRNVINSIFESGIDVSYMILEKVLFQNEEDYYWADEQFNKRKIEAWVNCVRRETPGYNFLKCKLNDSKSFVFKVYGSDWGLCCNGIHFLDAISFLADDAEIILDDNGLELPILDSKRVGFKECFGTISGKAGKCTGFSIECDKNDYVSTTVYIESNKFSILIDEDKRQACIRNNEQTTGFELIDFEFPYVSELSGRIINDILTTGVCELPSYQKSMEIHLKYIKMINSFFINNGLEVKECPIT